jgi:hypothetical protein
MAGQKPRDAVKDIAKARGVAELLAPPKKDHDAPGPTGVGSPEFFGRALRSVRIARAQKLETWATQLGVGIPALSRLERGHSELPPRDVLAVWGHVLRLPEEDQDYLMLAAGYLPITGYELSVTRTQFDDLQKAVRALLRRPAIAHLGWTPIAGFLGLGAQFQMAWRHTTDAIEDAKDKAADWTADTHDAVAGVAGEFRHPPVQQA